MYIFRYFLPCNEYSDLCPTTQGYVRQAYCHACLDQNRDAVRAFAEGLKRAENDEDKSVILSQIVSLALNLPGNARFFIGIV